MLQVIKHYKIWFLFSGSLMLASLVLVFVWGLRPGIDFRGGSLAELEFSQKISTPEIRQKLLQEGFADVVVQPVSQTSMIIKT